MSTAAEQAGEKDARAELTLCVFTPTYNRAYILQQLYDSLVAQTSRDFYWMICDDGSQDDTAELVEKFCAEGLVDIDYFRVENGGKQRAINYGVERCPCELFCCIDSDDYLVPTAVQDIIEAWAPLRADQSIVGLLALRGTDADTPLTTWIPEGVTRVKMWDLSEKYGITGDLTLVHRTSVLREYPYDVAPGEKFVAESSVFFLLDEKYDMYTLNKVLTICHYLPDGYTNNFFSIAKNNPIGYYKHKRYCAARSQTLKSEARETTLYLVGCQLAHKKGAVREAPNVPLAALCYLPSVVARYTLFR